MTAIKEKFITLLDFMSDEEAERALELIKENFTLKAKTWNDIEDIELENEDLILLSKIRKKEDDYGEYVSQDELLRSLNLSDA